MMTLRTHNFFLCIYIHKVFLPFQVKIRVLLQFLPYDRHVLLIKMYFHLFFEQYQTLNKGFRMKNLIQLIIRLFQLM